MFFQEKMVYEDMALCPMYTYYADCLGRVENTYYYYYQREDSITHETDAEYQKEEAKALLLLLEECDRRGITEKYPEEVEAMFTKYFYAWGMYGELPAALRNSLPFFPAPHSAVLSDTRISLVSRKDGGLGPARNFGIDMAQGQYIYIVRCLLAHTNKLSALFL